LFEAELARRGLQNAAGPSAGQRIVWLPGARVVVTLDNLAREFTGGSDDPDMVSRFTDQLISAVHPAPLDASRLYWCLEPNDYQHAADYRAGVSPQLDRVLVHASDDGALTRWVTSRALGELGLSADEAARRGWSNLDAALRRAVPRTYTAPGGATLVSFAAGVPSKASLLLAPALREIVSSLTGWPVLAVAPDSDFLYVWNAAHRELIARLGQAVIREHSRAPHPLSTEVFEISDTIRATGNYQNRTSPPAL